MRDLLLLLLGALLNEGVELTPHLMQRLVRLAARDLPEGYRETLEAEWLAELEACPGKLAKLAYIFPLLIARAEVIQAIREAEGRLPLETTWAQGFMRAFDLLTVLISAPVWIPMCAMLAVLVWMEDKHPPLYSVARVGKNGRVFRTWKFRTMVPDAEEVLRRKLTEDLQLRLEWEAHFKLRCDPRITQVGALLRKTSLDELPQLVNVLRGEMSLIGPRPLPPSFQSQLSPETQQLRAHVRPGMTGLWQVTSPSEAGRAGMERWDSYYVRNAV